MIDKVNFEGTEYRLILVLPDYRKVLAVKTAAGYLLPSVRIPYWTRHANELQKAIQATWKLHVIILDLLASPEGMPLCAVAEVLLSPTLLELQAVVVEQLEVSELTEERQAQLISLLSGGALSSSPFSRIGWIDEAILWLESETGRKLTSKSQIEHYNAGGRFSLVHFHTDDSGGFWLKATGEPNAHELSITRLLSELVGDYLPKMISSRPGWNAWLMSGEGTPIPKVPTDLLQTLNFLEGAVASLGALQTKTAGRSPELLGAGAFDQGLEVFHKRSQELFDFLEEAMGAQTSAKVPRLDKSRLLEIRAIFEEVCGRMKDLDIPATIVHGDMNCGNILVGCEHCQFIDWCEAYVGNPLITLQHLLLLNRVKDPKMRALINSALKDRYRNALQGLCDPKAIERGFAYMPLLAMASALYGRGDWLTTSGRDDPHRQAYARGLARHIDHAARDPELVNALRS